MTGARHKPHDAVVVGYNESPFDVYEELIRGYGRDSEAYRDLMYSAVELEGRKMNYLGLMNHALHRAQGGEGPAPEVLRSGDVPNLAAVYLTNYLRLRGYRADYVNLFQYEKERFARLLEPDPVCVAITTTFYVVNQPASEVVRFVREQNPGVPVVIGGPLVGNHVRNYQGDALYATLDDLGADIYVVESQGEATLTRIIDTLKSGGSLSRIPNLIYREGGTYHHSDRAPESNPLDENSIDWRRFSESELGPTLQTRTARSCAFSCAFCNYPARAGKLTLASVDTIAEEIDSMAALGDVENVVFIDDTFNVPLPRFKEICRLLIERDYGFKWFSYFRCSNSDEEAVELMAESGCTGVFLGIESGSPSVLVNMNKRATIDKYRRGIEMLRDHGVLTFGSFITGFPGESEETVQETIDFIRETRPDFFRSQLWYCEKNTPIEMQRDRYGIEGDGFVWSHGTMDSLEGMDAIDRMFLSVSEDESLWLPQWSFDFWIIPYLLGKNISRDQFTRFMRHANRLMALNVATVPESERQRIVRDATEALVAEVGDWNVRSSEVVPA